ncbi:MAG TPA: hypothetical protein VFW95_04210 [Candidatus Limnocylindria bacterium]|nr:hypothetical protein [Candidatus Limnocylindria bacterium]
MILHPASRSRRLGLPGLAHGDRLATTLVRRLDDDYHWFRSVAPGGMAPIDAVAVGPGGTWAITYGGERGRFAHRNGHWYRWNRSTESWVPWDASAITGARLTGHRLSLYLERASLTAAVSALLFGPPGMDVELERGEQPSVLVETNADRLATRLSAEERLSRAQVDRIVALLDPRQPLPRLAQATPSG